MIRNILVMAFILGAFLLIGYAMAGEAVKAQYDYVGVKKCKICHKKDGIHPSWLETKHAKAWEILKPEDQKNEKCIGCHSTGKDAKGVLLEGVQCEACHGAGSAYKKKTIMENTEKSIANGLVMPDEKTCLKCHNENIPEEFRPKEKFEYKTMKAKGVHAKRKIAEKKS